MTSPVELSKIYRKFVREIPTKIASNNQLFINVLKAILVENKLQKSVKQISEILNSTISRHIWQAKYRYQQNGEVIDNTIQDTWKRVARAIASAEDKDQGKWENIFYEQLKGFKFLPGGRIIAGAGTERNVTLFNCFVMGTIEDSIPSIFEHIKEGAQTMQWGGGIGYNFSTLRPKGSLAKSTNNISSGPVSFMKIWDAMCDTMMSTGARRGAMMGTLSCDHPDILSFIKAKREAGELTNFNLSVLVTDAFMKAVEADRNWDLVFPIGNLAKAERPDNENHIILKKGDGSKEPVECKVFDTLKAREIWDQIMKSTYDYAEPGVLFIDHINNMNNLSYIEEITCTNPCGEVPLPPYGACNLGSINLTTFVENPFSESTDINLEGIRETTRIAVRMLDNVTSISRFPLEMQKNKAQNTRRIGLGITGLADALIMLNLHYGSEEGRKMAANIMREICHEAYRTSIDLAKEKGSFPDLNTDAYLESAFIQNLPQTIQEEIKEHGIRNSHLLSIAPTGSISLLANNVSSGLEPVFDYEYKRGVLNKDGSTSQYEAKDYAYRLWSEEYGFGKKLPDSFIKARELSPEDHLNMQSVLQQFVDNSISKTINVPEDFPFSSFKNIYENAYHKGLKGCTTFRPNKTTGSVLNAEDDTSNEQCCTNESDSD